MKVMLAALAATLMLAAGASAGNGWSVSVNQANSNLVAGGYVSFDVTYSGPSGWGRWVRVDCSQGGDPFLVGWLRVGDPGVPPFDPAPVLSPLDFSGAASCTGTLGYFKLPGGRWTAKASVDFAVTR